MYYVRRDQSVNKNNNNNNSIHSKNDKTNITFPYKRQSLKDSDDDLKDSDIELIKENTNGDKIIVNKKLKKNKNKMIILRLKQKK